MRGRGQALLCCALLVLLCPSALAAPPPSPPADVDHDPLAASPRLGIAAGQLRFWGAAGAAFDHDAQLALQANTELMTLAFVGIRISMLALPLTPADGGSSSWSWRVGPSLHFLPYRRLDLGLFLEGGASLISPFDQGSTWAPTVAAGLTADLSLGSYWFIHLEGQLAWSVFSAADQSRTLLAPTALLGIGVQL